MGSSSHTGRQDIIRAAFLQEDRPPAEAPHFAWEKNVLKIGWKKQLPGTTVHPDSGDFTYTAPISVCLPNAPPSFSFWAVLTWNRLYCIWACKCLWAWQPSQCPQLADVFGNILKHFWNILRSWGYCKMLLLLWKPQDYSSLHEGTGPPDGVWAISSRLRGLHVCIWKSVSGVFQSKRASKTELQNKIGQLHAKNVL